MARVRLVHWHAGEAAERAELLRALGHDVDARPIDPARLRELTREPPEALVVDLTRLPSQGRDAAVVVRRSRTARTVPIVFLGGTAEKVARVRETLPDATFAEWEDAERAIAAALATPPRDPVVPPSSLAAYANTPLPRKLGIAPGAVVALVDAPADAESLLGPLPDGARVRRSLRGRCDLVLAFVRTHDALERRFAAVAAAGAPVWFLWPKRASGVDSDLTQQRIRDYALARGLVDHKVASVDATWTGLRFVRRR